MSSIGTGVAAGVAQTSLQSQQVARQKEKRANQTAAESKQLAERGEAIHVLDEADSQTPDQLRIDGHLPEHHPDTGDANDAVNVSDAARAAAAEKAAAAQTDDTAEQNKPDKDGGLHHHLDIKA